MMRARRLLGTARMTRPLMGAAALALTLLGLAPASAHAQLTGTIREFTGRTRTPTFSQLGDAEFAVTAEECDSSSIDARFTGIGDSGSLIFFEGSNCQVSTPARGSDESTCRPLDYEEPTEMLGMRDITIPLNRLLDCATMDAGEKDVFVLAIDNETDDVTADQVFTFPLRWDFSGPGAVSGLAVGAGEDAANLTWEGSTAMLRRYDVFLDPEGCVDGMVVGALAGESPPDSLIVATPAGTAASATAPFPDSVPIGGQAAVAIRGVDEAGNPGTLTARCVTRREVTTWWEMYCGSGGSEACRSSGCSVQPHSSSPALPAALAALGVGLLLTVRRRNR